MIKKLEDDVDLFKQLLIVFAEAFGEHEAYQSKVPSDEYIETKEDVYHFDIHV